MMIVKDLRSGLPYEMVLAKVMDGELFVYHDGRVTTGITLFHTDIHARQWMHIPHENVDKGEYLFDNMLIGRQEGVWFINGRKVI